MAASRESSRTRRASSHASPASPRAAPPAPADENSAAHLGRVDNDDEGRRLDHERRRSPSPGPVASTSQGTGNAVGEAAYSAGPPPHQHPGHPYAHPHPHPPPPASYPLWRDGVSYAHAPDLTHYLESTFVPSVVPQPDEYHAKDQARQYLEKLADQVSPGAKLLPFGSMANGFALKNSDMDLCCFLAKDAAVREPAELVELLGQLIEQETNFYVKTLPRARIPIIKLTIPPTPEVPMGMACDIGFENRLALENTRLLLTYAMIDTRLRTLVLFLKVWTKRRKINNPYRGTLSSYGYVLLVIQFLCHIKQPPLLPNLQRLSSPDGPPKEETIFDGHDISFFDDLETLPSLFQTTNTETSGELLIDFFRYFSKDFNYAHQVISIRSEKGVLPKIQKGWHTDFEFDPELTVRDQHKLCIEDPFQLDYNVARTVTKDGLYTIRGEFIRAFRVLTTPTRSPEGIGAVINSLCEEREDYLHIHPADDPTAHYSHRLYPGSPAHSQQQRSPRRRSAPSPRMGPTAYAQGMHHQPPHLGQSPVLGRNHPFWDGMNNGAPMNGDTHAARAGFHGGGEGAQLEPNGLNGAALAEPFHPGGPANDQTHHGRPPHPSGEYPYGGRPPIQHASTPPTAAGSPTPPAPATLDAARSSSRERRQSWDGSTANVATSKAGGGAGAAGGAALNGGYDLHRFFQNPQQQPPSSSVSEVGGPTSTAMAAVTSNGSSLNGRGTVSLTAPSSPDMMSQSAYFAGHPPSNYAHAYAGRSQHRQGASGPVAPYPGPTHVGPRLASSVPRNPHTAHHAYTNPYASAPVPYPLSSTSTAPSAASGSGYVTPTGYPLGGAGSPVPGAAASLSGLPPPPAPIFPEEDREAIALANNITFGSFPEMLPLPSYAHYHASGGSAAYLAGAGGWGSEPYGISGPMRVGNRTHGPGGGPRRPVPRYSLSSTAENEHSGEEDEEGDGDEATDHFADPAEHGLGVTHGARHPVPSMLGEDLSPVAEDDGARAPRVRGRSAPHVRMGPDGRETLLFGAIEVTLPRPEDVEEAEQEEEMYESADEELEDSDDGALASGATASAYAATEKVQQTSAAEREVPFLGSMPSPNGTPDRDGGAAAATDEIPTHALHSIPILTTQPPTPAKAPGSPCRNALGLVEEGAAGGAADSPTRPSRAGGSRSVSPRRSMEEAAGKAPLIEEHSQQRATTDEHVLLNGLSELELRTSS